MTTTPLQTSDTAARTKAIAQRFFDCFDSNDIAGAVALLADDASYWLAGKPELLPGVGSLTKPQIAKVFDRMSARLEDGLRMKVIGAIAEGDTAAFEVESFGTLKNGRVYRNQYHFLITVRGERIVAVKEYLDTQHVHATWYAD